MKRQCFTKSMGDVPGITRIIGILAEDSRAHWAWKLGIDGIDYREALRETVETGNLVRELIYDFLNGERGDQMLDGYPLEVKDGATCCFENFKKWWEHLNTNVRSRVVLLEHSMVSEKYLYGGTVDAVLVLDGEYVIVDFKIGDGGNESAYLQLAAYRQLLAENEELECKEARVIRIPPNEDEKFEEYIMHDFETPWRIFQNCLEIHKNRKKWVGLQ